MTTNLNHLGTTRAVWRADRTLHVRAFSFPRAARLRRVGLKPVGPDWVTAFRVLAWTGTRWRVMRAERGLPRPRKAAPVWYDLGGWETTAVLIEPTECASNGGWTCWTMAADAFVLEGDAPPAPTELPRDTRLELVECRPARGAILLPGEVRFQSRHLQVGFGLSRAGFRYLSVDDEGQSRTGRNLLQLASIFYESGAFPPECRTQGLRLHPVGGPCAVGILDHQVCGTVAVRGRTVTYDIEVPGVGQHYRLRWEVASDRLRLTAERVGDKPLRAWNSSAWHLAFNSTVAAVTNLGRVTRRGEAGLVELPVLLHAPGFGTFRVQAQGRAASWRADSIRPLTTVTSELKLGEAAQPEGDYLLLPGRHKAELEFVVTQHRRPVRRGTPQVVRRALNRCSLTALTYRADTATLTNNGNSVHAICCADNWSALVPGIGRILPNLHARDLLRDTLTRHLNGGTGYAGGWIIENGKRRRWEDEFIMSGTAFLLAVAEYLENGLKPTRTRSEIAFHPPKGGARSPSALFARTDDAAWLRLYRPKIAAELRRMRARDLDGDGLVESPRRLGISGQHHWATSWYDVISFGWKDAFANALLYPALVRLGEKQWAAKLRQSFWKAFYNERTGWFGGWRCQADKLHDYAFLFVNGAAVCHGLVDPQPAREIIGRLWDELQRGGLPRRSGQGHAGGPPDYRLGLPGNLWNIPYADLAIPMAEGIYENKSLTLSQARHFVGALYQVGMTKEGDTLLHAMLESLGNGTAFSGCGTGVDWRRWDGAACGYEGLLTDQLGVLALAMKRYQI